jgi:hypothetical protein
MHRETRIIKTAFWNTADERHLAAFKTNADRTAGTRSLAFAAATGSFSVTAGFTLTQTLGAMFRAGTRFKIV